MCVLRITLESSTMHDDNAWRNFISSHKVCLTLDEIKCFSVSPFICYTHSLSTFWMIDNTVSFPWCIVWCPIQALRSVLPRRKIISKYKFHHIMNIPRCRMFLANSWHNNKITHSGLHLYAEFRFCAFQRRMTGSRTIELSALLHRATILLSQYHRYLRWFVRCSVQGLLSHKFENPI